MRKLFILFVAIVSLNSLFVQKASSDEYSEFIGTAAIDGVTYSLNYSAYNTQYFAAIVTFPAQGSGTFVIPQNFEHYVKAFTYDEAGVKTFTVTGILENALQGSNISTIDLPSSINHVDETSFKGSEKLTTVIVRATIPPVVYDYTWHELTNTCLFDSKTVVFVYVPNENVEDYEDNTNWGKSPIRPLSEYVPTDLPYVSNTANQTTKRIVNGHILLNHCGKTYNAIGQEVK